jgi:hypothetical protein
MRVFLFGEGAQRSLRTRTSYWRIIEMLARRHIMSLEIQDRYTFGLLRHCAHLEHQGVFTFDFALLIHVNLLQLLGGSHFAFLTVGVNDNALRLSLLSTGNYGLIIELCAVGIFT